MKLRFAAFFAAGLTLSGCSDVGFSFDDILNFGSDTAEAPAPGSATAATAAAVPPSAFCRNVAQQDATEGAFDPATQARMAQKSYAQCVALYGTN
jgi:hypothetical protein